MVCIEARFPTPECFPDRPKSRFKGVGTTSEVRLLFVVFRVCCVCSTTKRMRRRGAAREPSWRASKISKFRDYPNVVLSMSILGKLD